MTTAIRHWVSRFGCRKSRGWVRKDQAAHFAGVLGCTSLCMAIAKCEEAVEASKPQAPNLSREQCIKQACLLSVNSATTLLTTTSSALLDICNDYKDSLTKILSLLEELQTVQGENPTLWDEIVEARGIVNKTKAAVIELHIYMTTVEKVVNSTTEAAFLAGAEYLCTVLCERLYSTQKEIGYQIAELKKLEEEYIKMQKEIVLSKENKGQQEKEKDNKKENIKAKTIIDINNALKELSQ